MAWSPEEAQDGGGAPTTEVDPWSAKPAADERLQGYHPGVTIEDIVASAIARTLALAPHERDEPGQSPVTGAFRRLLDRHPEFTAQLAAIADVGPPQYTTDPVARDAEPLTPPLIPDTIAALEGLLPAQPEVVPVIAGQGVQFNG